MNIHYISLKIAGPKVYLSALRGAVLDLRAVLCDICRMCSLLCCLSPVGSGMRLSHCWLCNPDRMELLVVELIWWLYSLFPSPPDFGSHLLGIINSYTFYLFPSETQSFILPFSSRLPTRAPENSEYPWDVQTIMFPWLELLNAFSWNNCFRIPRRDLPQGWIIPSGRMCGMV